MTPCRTIAILGAGFSGSVTAVHLLRAAVPGSLRVLLVDGTGPFGRGLAYRNWDDNQVLNVPAGNMSALEAEPGHFLAHCQRIDPALNAGSFVPRRVYGDYLEQLLADAETAAPGVLQRVHGEAVALRPDGGRRGFGIVLADGRQIDADQVVLAWGHFAPVDAPAGLAGSAHYLANPWNLQALDALPRTQPVLLLGSGHTAVDALFRLTSSGPRPVLMLSRRGLLPHGHRMLPKAPAGGAFPAWLADAAPTVRGMVRAMRRQAALCEADGGDWRDVMNELRPHTPALWQGLCAPEQRRFVTRVLPWWDIHRHRLAPTAHRRLCGLLASGQVQQLAGRLLRCEDVPGGLQFAVRRRGDVEVGTLLVGAAVNCTGPNFDIRRVAAPLVRQLCEAGMLQQDALQLGLQVDADYQLVDAAGLSVAGLHYVGPMLRARHWEAIAVPELRGHAAQLAARLLLRQPQHGGSVHRYAQSAVPAAGAAA